MANMKLLIYSDTSPAKNVTELVQKVNWGGRDGSSSRTLDVTFTDSPNFPRIDVDVLKGFQCKFFYDDEELFEGLITKTTPSSKGAIGIKAYDNGYYLSRNKDAFHYTRKTASYIFTDICKRFNLPVDSVAKCSTVISEISKSTTAWDVIETALQEEYKATGIRHAVVFDKGKGNLLTRRENIVKWILETDTNIISWNLSRSIEKLITRVKLYSKENETLAVAKNTELESKIGIFQDVNKPDDSAKKRSQLNTLAQSLLNEKSNPEYILNVTANGITAMRTGRGAFVIIPEISVNQSFYISQDTHSFQGDKYTMSLKLEKTTDLKY